LRRARANLAEKSPFPLLAAHRTGPPEAQFLDRIS
jgi:hypothetical protein